MVSGEPQDAHLMSYAGGRRRNRVLLGQQLIEPFAFDLAAALGKVDAFRTGIDGQPIAGLGFLICLFLAR